MGNKIDIAIVKDGEKIRAKNFLYHWIKDKDSYIKLDECTFEQQDNGVVILFNYDSCLEGESFSYFYSAETEGVVLSIYVYDSDYWGYTLYDAGKEIDVFCTRPDWLISNASWEEQQRYSGNSAILSQYFNVRENNIKNYLVTWTEEDYDVKAYPDDVYGQSDWQILDFMAKLGYEYPNEEDSADDLEDYAEQTNMRKTECEFETIKTSKQKSSKLVELIMSGMGIIFIIVALMFINPYTDAKRKIEENGVQVKAEIIEISSWRNGRGEQRHSVYIEYSYNGQEYGKFLNKYTSSMYEGKVIQITIDKKNPYDILDAGVFLIFIRIFGLVGAVFLVIGGLIFNTASHFFCLF